MVFTGIRKIVFGITVFQLYSQSFVSVKISVYDEVDQNSWSQVVGVSVEIKSQAAQFNARTLRGSHRNPSTLAIFTIRKLEGRAGLCLEERKSNSNCFGVLYSNRTAEECCNQYYGNYYTIENYSFEERFRVRISGNGFPNCLSCADWKQPTKGSNTSVIKDKCKDVNCGPNKVCKFRHNTLTCVCRRPKCKRLPSSPVCSNHNKTYRNECALNRHACINNKQEYVAYDGPCRDSCKYVQCREGKQCIEFEDKNKMPYCVSCDRLCTDSSSSSPVCGADNTTYSSHCELRMATCRRGKTIGIAYTGACKARANCSNVVCPRDMLCLMDYDRPQCVRCSSQCTDMDSLSSLRQSAHPLAGKLCGTDHETYPNLCALRKNSCKTQKFIGILHHGECKIANCSSVVCHNGETCLMDKIKPRCVMCSMAHCMTLVKLALERDPRHHYGKPMCGTDQSTYPHLCALNKQACKTGKFIGIQHHGACRTSNGVKINQTQAVNGLNDQSYKPMTSQIVEVLKNKTITVKELTTLLQTFGLRVKLDDSSNQQMKTLNVYSFFCHLMRYITKGNITGCS